MFQLNVGLKYSTTHDTTNRHGSSALPNLLVETAFCDAVLQDCYTTFRVQFSLIDHKSRSKTILLSCFIIRRLFPCFAEDFHFFTFIFYFSLIHSFFISLFKCVHTVCSPTKNIQHPKFRKPLCNYDFTADLKLVAFISLTV